jgi:hypothetical protein
VGAGPLIVRVPIPTTIQRLISAGLERLEPEQLQLPERAAVVGQVFGWSDVAALCAVPPMAYCQQPP